MAKCRCNGSSETGCYWCSGSGYKRKSKSKGFKAAESTVQAKPAALMVAVPQKPYRERILALKEELYRIERDTLAESINAFRKKIAVLLTELTIWEKQVAAKELIRLHKQEALNLKMLLETRVKGLLRYNNSSNEQHYFNTALNKQL